MTKREKRHEEGAKLPFLENIGMRLLDTDDSNNPQAIIDVSDKNCQPWGFLCGGATIGAAETLAGIASCNICPDNVVVGMSVTANHISPASVGEQVLLTATAIHIGKTTHVWRIDATSEGGRLVSTVNVTNYIVHK